MTTSKKNPNIIPKISPSFLPANNPMHNIKITNKFGFTFAIVNHEKRFDCIKYIIKKLNIINTIDNTFFKSVYLPFFVIYSSILLVITKTVFNLLKSTAVCTIAYLSVMLLVFITSVIVPI